MRRNQKWQIALSLILVLLLAFGSSLAAFGDTADENGQESNQENSQESNQESSTEGTENDQSSSDTANESGDTNDENENSESKGNHSEDETKESQMENHSPDKDETESDEELATDTEVKTQEKDQEKEDEENNEENHENKEESTKNIGENGEKENKDENDQKDKEQEKENQSKNDDEEPGIAASAFQSTGFSESESIPEPIQVDLHAPHRGVHSEDPKDSGGDPITISDADGGLTEKVVWHFVLNQIPAGYTPSDIHATFQDSGTKTASGSPVGNGQLQHFFIGTDDHDILIDAYVLLMPEDGGEEILLSIPANNQGKGQGKGSGSMLVLSHLRIKDEDPGTELFDLIINKVMLRADGDEMTDYEGDTFTVELYRMDGESQVIENPNEPNYVFENIMPGFNTLTGIEAGTYKIMEVIDENDAFEWLEAGEGVTVVIPDCDNDQNEGLQTMVIAPPVCQTAVATIRNQLKEDTDDETDEDTDDESDEDAEEDTEEEVDDETDEDTDDETDEDTDDETGDETDEDTDDETDDESDEDAEEDTEEEVDDETDEEVDEEIIIDEEEIPAGGGGGGGGGGTTTPPVEIIETEETTDDIIELEPIAIPEGTPEAVEATETEIIIPDTVIPEGAPEPVEPSEVIILDEEIPLGVPVLPQTGEGNPLFFYLAGLLLAGTGLVMKSRYSG
ncbi:LPXTG-motif cell wall anchor domain-containing protein [Tindallia magadiensis]|uniref:LPXTG-motif cell wall anchor domain-containing protein n=1 Tax=Tindallia magadiensis TaxID=69895 RepID=A0A1I3D0A9_9FIRM|nr:LPXTG cell wall anchor domain-containing protein [Tindallia magadiensis]SFH79969.1 LPXTG-motif cell wall anchor domain-containing protein [Tindallia magadiensis]